MKKKDEKETKTSELKEAISPDELETVTGGVGEGGLGMSWGGAGAAGIGGGALLQSGHSTAS